MIEYEFNDDVIVAKFYEEGLSLKDIWISNLYMSLMKHIERMHFKPDANDIVKLIDTVMRDRKLVGIAKCHPNDEYNEYIGMDMAKNDLIRRYKQAETQLKIDFLALLEKDVNILIN